jgi:hypothetical protein
MYLQTKGRRGPVGLMRVQTRQAKHNHAIPIKMSPRTAAGFRITRVRVEATTMLDSNSHATTHTH